jgi:hypothetical protein
MKYLRVEMPTRSSPGVANVVKNDKVLLIDDEDVVIGDLAETVTSWRVRSDVGNLRVLELRVIRFEVVELEE